MERPTGRRLAGVLAALACGITAVGAGHAYWTAPGSGGSGAASTATTVPITLTPGTPTDQLYPGGQATAVLTVSNPSSADVRIGTLALDTSQGTGGFGVDGGHADCTLTTLSFATQTNGGAGWVVPGDGVLPITLEAAFSMTADAVSACQGATFAVYLTATG